MNTDTLILGALILGALAIGAAVGFLINGVRLQRAGETKPDALTADPREVVAVYEALRQAQDRPRREMDERMKDEGGRMRAEGERMKGEIKAWEKEQAKREKKRRR